MVFFECKLLPENNGVWVAVIAVDLNRFATLVARVSGSASAEFQLVLDPCLLDMGTRRERFETCLTSLMCSCHYLVGKLITFNANRQLLCHVRHVKRAIGR